MTETKAEYIARWKGHDALFDRLRALGFCGDILTLDYPFIGYRIEQILAEEKASVYDIPQEDLVGMIEGSEQWLHEQIGRLQEAMTENLRRDIQKILRAAGR